MDEIRYENLTLRKEQKTSSHTYRGCPKVWHAQGIHSRKHTSFS